MCDKILTAAEICHPVFGTVASSNEIPDKQLGRRKGREREQILHWDGGRMVVVVPPIRSFNQIIFESPPPSRRAPDF